MFTVKHTTGMVIAWVLVGYMSLYSYFLVRLYGWLVLASVACSDSATAFVES
jgi:hypothetical protein